MATTRYGNFYDAAGGFAHSTLLLSGGALAAQIIPAAMSPILTRLYSMGDFGEFALFLAALGITGQMACLKYDVAAMVVQNEHESVFLFYLCLMSTSVISSLLLLTLPAAAHISHLIGARDGRWVYLLPMGTLLMGINTALTALALRIGCLHEIAASAMARALALAAGQLALSPLSLGALGMASAYVAASAIALCILLSAVWPLLRIHAPDWSSILRVSLRYASYPGYTTMGALANGLVYNASSFFLSSLYTSSLLGCYSLINRLLSLPLTVISGSVGQLFVNYLSRCKGGQRAFVFLRVSSVMFLLSVTMSVVLFLSAPLIPLIFGVSWKPAITMMRVMIPLFAVRFVVSPVSSAAIVAGETRATTIWQLSLLGASWIPARLAYLHHLPIEDYLWMFGGMLCVGYLVFYAYCLLVLRKGDSHAV